MTDHSCAEDGASKYLMNITWLLWLTFIVIISIFTFRAHSTVTHPVHTVTFNYWLGAKNWLQGNDLYNNTGRGFIYFPQSAVLYAPLTFLPFVLSEVILRVVLLVIFALAIFWFSGLFERRSTHFFFASIFSIIIGFSAARFGQFNLVIAEGMLLALFLMHIKQYWLSTIVLCIGLALKPLMLPLMLILLILVPQMRIKILLGILVLLLFPFLTQHPAYVLRQYLDVPTMLQQVSAQGNNQSDDHWSQLYILLRQFGIVLPHAMQDVLLLLGGLITLSLCALVRVKYYGQSLAVLYIYLLVAVFLMIFNPRNEGNSFVILAPAIGFFLTDALNRKQIIQVVLTACVFFGIIVAPVIIHLFTHPQRWFSPLMAIVLFFTVLPSIIYTMGQDQS